MPISRCAIGQPPESVMRVWASSQGVWCLLSVSGRRYTVLVQGILRRLCVLSPGRWEVAVHPMPALRSWRANVGVETKGEVHVVGTRSPVLTHSPVQPVPALWRVRARVVIQPGGVVPRLCTRAPVLPHSPVLQVPPPNTKPPGGLPSLVGPVAAPRTRLSLCLLPTGVPVCPELLESPVCISY